MKIAMLLPVYRDPAFQFVMSLVGLVAHTAKVRPDIELRPVWGRSSMVAISRNNLLDEAIQWEADYALLIDSDMTFPPDALLRLLGHDLEVVGTNASRRADPTGPTAANQTEDGKYVPVWTTEEAAKAGKMERVGRIGLGLVLLKMSIVDKLQASATDGSMGPLFHFELRGQEITSEDYYFCERLERAEIPVHVDHLLSWHVGHVHERVLFPSDAEAHRADNSAILKSPE